MSSALQTAVARLAYDHPALREHLLPALREAKGEEEEEGKGPSKKPGGKFLQFLKEEGDMRVTNPDTGNQVKLKSLKGERGKKMQKSIFDRWLKTQEKAEKKKKTEEGAKAIVDRKTKKREEKLDKDIRDLTPAQLKKVREMKEGTLRKATIRLAHENPALREHLLPILAKVAAPKDS